MNFFKSKTGIILRWIFFIPLSLLVFLLASLLGLLFEYSRSYFGFSDGGEWSLMVAPMIGTYGFFYAIWKIVPKFKITFMYIFLAIGILGKIIELIFYNRISGHLLSFGMTIVFTIGLTIQTLFQIYQFKNDDYS